MNSPPSKLPKRLNVAAPRHMAKKKSFRSAPRIVSGRESDRWTVLTRLMFGMRHLKLVSLDSHGKSHERKFTAAMAIPTPNRTPARILLDPPSPNANVSPATTMATSESPRAIVLVNACCRTLTAFSHGEFPVCAKTGDAKSKLTAITLRFRAICLRRVLFGQSLFIQISFFDVLVFSRRVLAVFAWPEPRGRVRARTTGLRRVPWSFSKHT